MMIRFTETNKNLRSDEPVQTTVLIRSTDITQVTRGNGTLDGKPTVQVTVKYSTHTWTYEFLGSLEELEQRLEVVVFP
jgi:hypothetical protein